MIGRTMQGINLFKNSTSFDSLPLTAEFLSKQYVIVSWLPVEYKGKC